MMQIREALDSDLEAVMAVERAAFGTDEEVELVAELLDDPTARPTLSLLALEDGVPVGHVLFTKARLDAETRDRLAILAPLAVVPSAQRRGIGSALIRQGLDLLRGRGIAGVFVLGDPGYYQRHGFVPATPLGLDATHPPPAKHADAWMVQLLEPDRMRLHPGRVLCSDVLSRLEYWLEPE